MPVQRNVLGHERRGNRLDLDRWPACHVSRAGHPDLGRTEGFVGIAKPDSDSQSQAEKIRCPGPLLGSKTPRPLGPRTSENGATMQGIFTGSLLVALSGITMAYAVPCATTAVRCTVAPETNLATAMSALTVLIGGLAVLRGRKARA